MDDQTGSLAGHSYRATMKLAITTTIGLIYLVLAAFFFSRQMPPTGDEPHYLIAAHSLAVDGDLYLLNNYQEKQYGLFYPGVLAKRTTLSADRTKELPAFSPGTSLFLFPFYKLAVFFFPSVLVPFLRSVIAVVAAFSLYQLVRLTEIYSGNPETGLVLPAFALTSPLLTYCGMFYPEILAFFLITVALRFIVQEKPGLILSLVIPALLWLHPKYLVLALLLFFLMFYRLRKSPGKLCLSCLIAVAGLVSFFWFLHDFYGSWSPNRIYGGVQRQTNLMELIRVMGWERILIMLRMIPAFWLDQRFGVIPYAPVYICSVTAFIWMCRSQLQRFLPFLLLFVSHFLVISWGAQMGGYAPPSRHFVVLLPFLILPSLLFIQRLRLWQKMIVGGLSASGWVVSGLILARYRTIFTNATWRNPDGRSEFWSSLNLADYIPQLTIKSPDYWLAFVWSFAVLFVAWLLYPRNTENV